MSILDAQLVRLIHLVSELPLNTIYENVPQIVQQIANCRKLLLSEAAIQEAILRGQARRATR